jgi:hypothetical protein
VVWRRVPVLLALLAATACAGDDGVTPGTRVTTPFTGPARSLAPSQVAQPTVPPPTVPGRCDAAALDVAARLGNGADEPAVIVRFTNAGSVECEIDLGTEWAITHGVEPSVWLAPGASADLWGDGSACAAEAAWPLEVNGIAHVVALPAGAPCDVVPTAFFPP